MSQRSMHLWIYEKDIPYDDASGSYITQGTFDVDAFSEIKEKKCKGRSLNLRFKQREKLTRMLSHYEGYNGIYLDVNAFGFVKTSRKILVSSEINGYHQDIIIRDKLSSSGCFCSYFWTNKNKKLTIRYGPWQCCEKPKKKKRQRKRRKRREEKPKESKEKSKKKEPGGLNAAKKENEQHEALANWDNDNDFNVSDDEGYSDEEIHLNSRIKIKKLPRKMNYLFTDFYIKPRNSKRHIDEMKCYLSDFSFCPSRKQEKKKSATLNTFDAWMEPDLPENLTLESFLPAKGLFDLRSTSYFETTVTSKSQSKIEELNEESKSLKKSDGIERKFGSESELNITASMDQNPSSLKEDGETTAVDSNDDYYNNNSNENDQNVFVILPRLSVKVDNLLCEFKERYKEVLCKKRRFLLDVSHLAVQYLLRLNIHPCDLISQLDIKMYLIFVYLQRSSDENDKYRLWINSSVQVIKNIKKFHEITQQKVTSIHDIIQTAMEALKDLQLDSALKVRKDQTKDCILNYPVCSFHLLQSAMLKKRFLNYSKQTKPPNSLSLHRFSETRTLRIEGSSLMPPSNSLPSSDSGLAKKGPSESTMCGICLRQFDTNSIFPFALVACCHWFCEDCWTSKLTAQMKEQKNNSIYCIERHCNKTIDNVTLMSIMDLQIITNFYKNRKGDIFQNLITTNTCLNPSCQKQLQFFSADIEMDKPVELMPITCSCSWQYCPKCFGNPHWPANCDISAIYHNCIEAQGLNTFNRFLSDDELPTFLLRGKCCPKCGILIQEKTFQNKTEHCSCGCSFCWPCGKELDLVDKNYNHSLCIERFELSDKKLKHKMISSLSIDSTKHQSGRWFKIALKHREMRHPQVIGSLYKMAEQITGKVTEIYESGKHIGDVKSAAIGWKPVFKRWNDKRLRQLNRMNVQSRNQDSIGSYKEQSLSRPSSSSAGSESDPSLEKQNTDKVLMLVSNTPSINKGIQTKSLIRKAVCNIVQIKVEIHHNIEFIAVVLEFEHALQISQETGKVIRNLERAEDLCEALGLLLQEPLNGNISRVIPSFLRLRLQANNMLSTLHHHLMSI